MLRFVLALPIAGCLAIVLFSLMAWLVNTPQQTQQHSMEATKVSYLVSEQENEARTRSRILPPEPKVTPTQAPQTFV
ncbi:MAG: energy transducer TonB, partial [Vibrionaceae bacterium]|nr:energy transducer TonB [Vibrionaceae bacterium]